MSSSHSRTPPTTPSAVTARRRRTLLVATVVAGVFVIGAGIAAACIPWTGKLELENVNRTGDERGVDVYGADHSDVEKDGTTGGDRGNGQGMVWCTEDDTAVGQQYAVAYVHPDGDTSTDDVTLIVDDNNNEDSADGTTDDTEGCDSDLYLPEDDYSITYQEDSFDNHDGSANANGIATFADNLDSASNGGSAEVEPGHCMNIDDDSSDDETKGDSGTELYWNDIATSDNQLIEDDNGDREHEVADGGDDEETSVAPRFPHPADEGPDGGIRDVIDEGPHSVSFDFDQFTPDWTESGPDDTPASADSDDDGALEAASLCITSHAHFEHDNDDTDDDDSEVYNGNRDNKQIEYGNAVPIFVLQETTV